MNNIVRLHTHARRIAYLTESFPWLTFREETGILRVLTRADEIKNLRPYPGMWHAIDLDILFDQEQLLYDSEIREMCRAVNAYRLNHGVDETIEFQ